MNATARTLPLLLCIAILTGCAKDETRTVQLDVVCKDCSVTYTATGSGTVTARAQKSWSTTVQAEVGSTVTISTCPVEIGQYRPYICAYLDGQHLAYRCQSTLDEQGCLKLTFDVREGEGYIGS